VRLPEKHADKNKASQHYEDYDGLYDLTCLLSAT